MKKILIVIIILLFSFSNSIGGCIINCKARYLYQVYHPAIGPSYVGTPMGKIPLFESARDAYYEKVWSNTYYLQIKFFSGYELNEAGNKSTFYYKSIIAIVDWDDGGHSVITLEKWTTNLKYVTEEEIRYNNITGEKIIEVFGYDKANYYWEIHFL
jgi:hypothetical protein